MQKIFLFLLLFDPRIVRITTFQFKANKKQIVCKNIFESNQIIFKQSEYFVAVTAAMVKIPETRKQKQKKKTTNTAKFEGLL